MNFIFDKPVKLSQWMMNETQKGVMFWNLGSWNKFPLQERSKIGSQPTTNNWKMTIWAKTSFSSKLTCQSPENIPGYQTDFYGEQIMYFLNLNVFFFFVIEVLLVANKRHIS